MASFFRDLFVPADKSAANIRKAQAEAQAELVNIKELPLARYKAKLQRAGVPPETDPAIQEFPDLIRARHYRRRNKRSNATGSPSPRSNGRPVSPADDGSVDPDEAILSQLHESYFTDDCDELRLLFDRMPEDRTRLDFFLLEQVGFHDRIRDVIKLQLSREVQANYSSLIQGVRQVQDIDLGITHAGVQVKNARHKLAQARRRLVRGNLGVVKKHLIRQRIRDVRDRCQHLKTISHLHNQMRVAANDSELALAVSRASVILRVTQSPVAQQYNALKDIRADAQDFLQVLMHKGDEVLQRLCEPGLFDPFAYADVVNSCLLLDNVFANEPAHIRQQATGGVKLTLRIADKTRTHLVVMVTRSIRDVLLEKYEATARRQPDTAIAMDKVRLMSIDKLCANLPLSGAPSFVQVSVQIFALLSEVMRSFHLFQHWHESIANETQSESEAASNTSTLDTWLFPAFAVSGDGNSDSVNAPMSKSRNALLSPADRLIVAENWKESLNEMRQAFIAERANVWSAMQGKLRTLLASPAAGYQGLKVEQLRAFIDCSDEFAQIGSTFVGYSDASSLTSCIADSGGNMITASNTDNNINSGSSRILELRGLLRQHVKQYAAMFHKENVDMIISFLKREGWQRICVRVDVLGGWQALLDPNQQDKGRIRGLKRRSATDQLRVNRLKTGDKLRNKQQKDAVMMESPTALFDGFALGDPENRFTVLLDEWQKLAADSPETAEGTNEIQTNLDSDVDDDATDETESTNDEKGVSIKAVNTKTSSISDQPVSPIGGRGESGGPGTDEFVLTSTLINCLPKSVGRYVRLMEHVPLVAGEAVVLLQRLFDFYVYTIFCNAVPFRDASAALDWGATGFEELAKFVDECQTTLGIRRSQAAGQRKAHVTDLVATVLGQPTLTTNNLNGQANGSATANVNSNPSGASQSIGGAISASMARRGTTNSGFGNGNSATKVTVDGQIKSSMASSRQKSSKVPRRNVQLALGVDVDNCCCRDGEEFGVEELAQRVVAAESLSILETLAKTMRERIEAATPPVQKRDVSEALFNRLGLVSGQLRMLIMRGLARQLVQYALRDMNSASVKMRDIHSPASGPGDVTATRSEIDRRSASVPLEQTLSTMVTAIQWGQLRSLHTESNGYVDKLVDKMRAVWTRLQRECKEGNVYPVNICAPLWALAVEAVMDALLDAFAHVSKCSTEGRALMSLDFQSVSRGLEEIAPVMGQAGERAGRAKARVDKFIKAFYYDREQDLVDWASQNKKEFMVEHVVSLMECGVGAKLSQKKRAQMLGKLSVALLT